MRNERPQQPACGRARPDSRGHYDERRRMALRESARGRQMPPSEREVRARATSPAQDSRQDGRNAAVRRSVLDYERLNLSPPVTKPTVRRHPYPPRPTHSRVRTADQLRRQPQSVADRYSRLTFILLVALFFFLQQTINELVLRIVMVDNFFGIGLVHATLMNLARSMIVASVISFFPRKPRHVLFTIAMFFFPLIYSAQLIYYRFFRTFFVFVSIGEGGQVAQFWQDILQKTIENFFWILIMFTPVILYYTLLKKRYFLKRTARRGRLSDSFIGIGMALAVLGLAIGSMAFNQEYNSPWQNYFYQNQILTGTNQFGLLTAMEVDISHLIYTRSDPINPDLIPELPDESKPNESELLGDPSTEPSESTPQEEVFERVPQVLPIDFEARIANDNPKEPPEAVLKGQQFRDAVRYLDNVFSQTTPTYTNKMTGKGKGFNLIFVTAEAFSQYAIDEELTPTLWKMWHEGIHFKNFYNQVWTVSTLDGEYAGLTGMIPKQGVWTLYQTRNNDMAMVPGNVLKRMGYHTFAWHNHTWTYYKRDQSHPNLGYLYRGLGNGLDVAPTWPESDLEMMEKTVFEYVDKEPFHVYYLTVSGHTNWSRMGNRMTARHYDKFAHLDLPDEAISYKAANYEVELAMANLLEQLREAGIADRTLIVLNPDHYPYAMEQENLNALAGRELNQTFDIYQSAAFFYHDGIEPMSVDKYVSSLDLLPTIYNYMGIPYDSRFLSGRDVFNEGEGFVPLLSRSWLTDTGRYNLQTKEFTLHEGQTLEEDEEEYVARMNRLVQLRFETAKLIVDTDYYRYMFSDEDWQKINEPYLTHMRENPWPNKEPEGGGIAAALPEVTIADPFASGEVEGTTP